MADDRYSKLSSRYSWISGLGFVFILVLMYFVNGWERTYFGPHEEDWSLTLGVYLVFFNFSCLMLKLEALEDNEPIPLWFIIIASLLLGPLITIALCMKYPSRF